MITVKIFAFLGFAYLMLAVFYAKLKTTGMVCYKVWGFEPPSRRGLIYLGLSLIFFEVLIDLVVNLLF